MVKLVLGALASLLFVLASASAGAQEAAATPSKPTIKKARAKAKAAPLRVSAAPQEKLVRRVSMVNGKRRVTYQRLQSANAIVFKSAGDMAGLNLTRDPLDLKSSVALVLDENNSEVLFEKNANVALPIASITKLMTGLIVVQAQQDMQEMLTITDDDVDREKHSSSRLKVGARLTRGAMLHIALMSSENRAASALGRNYPGGLAAFVDAMNTKAQQLGMADTHYVDSSGLSSRNVASARDLAKLAMVAHQEPLLREYSTDAKAIVDLGGRPVQFSTTNYLVASPGWEIGLQKTGFINEAGRCLVMQAMISGRAVIMVFLDSKGKQSRTADAGRMRKWLEALKPPGMALSNEPLIR
jgi:D-alanyl-D-alanine endopeptidase (penicillin-binding protein 7)